MHKFILLHQGGLKRYININHIECVKENNNGETIIIPTNSGADFYRVDEHIDEVMLLINKAEGLINGARS